MVKRKRIKKAIRGMGALLLILGTFIVIGACGGIEFNVPLGTCFKNLLLGGGTVFIGYCLTEIAS